MDSRKRHVIIAVTAVAIIIILALTMATSREEAVAVTWDDLVSIDKNSAETVMSLEEDGQVTIQAVSSFTLLHAGVPTGLLKDYPFDWNMLSKNTGLMDGIKKGLGDEAYTKDLKIILQNSKPLANAFEGGRVTGPFFYNGIPQPVFPYTKESEDYSNENSDIIRYCVYVETDYDTDSDGKRDLIEVFLQIPRAAMEGGYKAPVVLIADPYEHSPHDHDSPTPADVYDMSRIYSQPDIRVPKGSVSAWDAAMAAKPSDWHYDDPDLRYQHHTQLGYYLLRGYATASCGLLGSYGSEGYACTGLELELLAVKSVIEWFDGDAVGYTSKDSLITTGADWCSGNVGMYGISYLGTMQVGVAAMGIDNLKTVMPANAIADWYEYKYQKGGLINSDTEEAYIPYLAEFISTARDPDTGDYHKFFQKIAYDETILHGQYTDGSSTYWMDRDYTKMDVDTETSVLLIHGLNDFNVRMSEFSRTYAMFKDSGVDMKVFLHQGAHQLHGQDRFIDLGESDGLATVNIWLSHYLFGQDTGVEQWPDLQVQSNLDGSWSEYRNLDPTSSIEFVSSDSGTKTIYSDEEEEQGVRIVLGTADSDMTVLGGQVRVKVSSDTLGIPDQPLSAAVYDSYGPGMKAYLNTNASVVDMQFVPLEDPERDLIWQGSGIQDLGRSEFVQQDTTEKMFSLGTVGLDYYGEFKDLDSMRLGERETGSYYEYVIDLTPTVYNLKKGHEISVFITAYDQFMFQDLEGELVHYDLTVDLSSVELKLDLIE